MQDDTDWSKYVTEFCVCAPIACMRFQKIPENSSSPSRRAMLKAKVDCASPGVTKACHTFSDM